MGLLAERYELGSVLGSGGFATVHRARDVKDDRDVAIKLIPLHDRGATAEPDELERFRNEALVLSRLRSRNIARVFDFGKDPTLGFYLVMELLDGVALEPSRLGRVLLPHEVLRAARALLSGLAEAHALRLVHRDVKPANIIVPGGIARLSELKILDFGIASSQHRAQLEDQFAVPPAARRVLGTPAYMAPEQLLGENATASSDVYAAGLVLFELLGQGMLFPERPQREQLVARTQDAVLLAGRVPPPLDVLLGKMLEREPALRFADAHEALTALVNMETAPVNLDELVPPSAVPSRPAPSRKSLPAPAPSSSLEAARLSALDENPTRALAQTLEALDLAMLDALARRERGSELGRVARAIALGLRLEIDAASLVLEPLTERGDLGRAVAVCLLAPRARIATRSRIERDIGIAGEGWLETVDLELGQQLVALEAAMCGPQDLGICLARCDKVLARDATPTPAQRTLALAQIALRARTRNAQDEGLTSFEKLAATDHSPALPLSEILRELIVAPLAFRADDHIARASFERASQLAGEAGVVYMEARALVAWGGMLIEVPGRARQGLAWLERAATLLLHGDAPSLEHMAAHNYGVGLIALGEYSRAVAQFRRAREVASGETPIEFELVSGGNEVLSRLASGDIDGGRAVARLLEVTRNVPVAPREATLVSVATALARLVSGDLPAARTELARTRDRLEMAGDARLLAEAVTIVCTAAAGEPVDFLARAADLQRMAEEHGFAAFYWFDAIKSAVDHAKDPDLRARASDAVAQLILLLGSPVPSRAARV